MKQALNKFNRIMLDNETAGMLYDHLTNKNVPLDSSDLLRWQWVQSVAALDTLIHDLVKIGMIEIFCEYRVPTKKYMSYKLDMKRYLDITANTGQAAVLSLEEDITITNSYKSFQYPDKIADALSYIWEQADKWQYIAIKAGMDKSTCVNMLKNVVTRRNQIAHEGDYIGNNRQHILKSDTEDVKNFIKSVGNSIYELVIDPSNMIS